MKTIFVENDAGQQHRIMCIDKYFDQILDQIDLNGFRVIPRFLFDGKDIVVRDIRMEGTGEKIGEISFKKDLLVANYPKDAFYGN